SGSGAAGIALPSMTSWLSLIAHLRVRGANRQRSCLRYESGTYRHRVSASCLTESVIYPCSYRYSKRRAVASHSASEVAASGGLAAAEIRIVPVAGEPRLQQLTPEDTSRGWHEG